MTYLEKWENFSTQNDWRERTRILFRFIPVKTNSILVLGCGKNTLRTLKLINLDEMNYISSDKTPGSEVDLVFDLNSKDLPRIQVDTIFFSGLLEYIFDVPRFLNWARLSSHSIVGSYSPLLHSPLDIDESIRRSRNGWKNHMSIEQFSALSLTCGWTIEFRGKYQEQVLFVGYRI